MDLFTPLHSQVQLVAVVAVVGVALSYNGGVHRSVVKGCCGVMVVEGVIHSVRYYYRFKTARCYFKS